MLNKFKIFLTTTCFALLVACGSHDKDGNVIKVGTISGPESELMEVAKQVAQEKYGLKLKLVEFTDYNQPNAALNDGSIEANVFQHMPYLDQQIKDHHYNLISVGKTFVYPMGVYSDKVKDIQTISTGGLIAIPNDPSNEGRALLLLQKAGIITLKSQKELYATPIDIKDNPKQLKFKELDAAQLARSLPDVDAAVINTNYAVPAGLSPTKDAIFREDKDSPYANIIVIRTDEANDPRISGLVKAIESPEVATAAKKIFNDQAIQAW